MDENTVKPKDLGKVFSFEPEDVKFHIDEFLDNDLDKAIVACYGLQPPRRLDFQYVRMTEDDPLMLTNKEFNYLVMSSCKPSLLIHNYYKTYSKYKQQVIR